VKLHFAYGSNMSRSHMAVRCPQARALGTAVLAGWRFGIGPDGYASIIQERGSNVYGVLWRLSPRDLAALNAYENVQGGLYRMRMLPVCAQGPANTVFNAGMLAFRQRRPVSALVYVARRVGTGAPRPGYMQLVLDAAREWKLPDIYLRALARWATTRWTGAFAPEPGEAA
jgi:hypothetical protein